MKRSLTLLLVSLILLASCATPTPTITPITRTPTVTPFVSPLTVTPNPSPLNPPTTTPPPPITKISTVTPTQSPPTPTPTPRPPIVIVNGLNNPDFERPYVSPAPALTLPDKWLFGWTARTCDPDDPTCPVRCPSNCINPATNRCVNDTGCYWAQPEAAEAWYGDYGGLRVHTGQSAIKSFTYGRMGEWWVYQPVSVVPGDVMTFSVYLSAWMCREDSNCSKGQRSDKPTAMHLRVGIDPTGGTSITSTAIVWSPEGDAFRIRKDDPNYWHKFQVTAQTSGFHATVFIYTRPDWSLPALDFPELYDGNYSRINNDLYVDTAQLEIARTGWRAFLPFIRNKRP